MAKKKFKIVVAMEMLLRVSGGGIAGDRTDELWFLLDDVDGIDDITVTRHHVGITKSGDAKWSTIISAVKKALARFFGRRVSITERTRRTIPADIELLFIEASAESTRERFQGCALTEDECDALGIDFNQHNLELRGVDY